MRKLVIILLLIIIITSNIYSFGPPLFRFYIKNSTGNKVMIHYSLNDDWLEYIDEGYLNEITNIYKVLENDELIEIRLSYTTMYNLRYRDELQFEKGYIEISHFMSIFSEFYIALIDSNIFLYKSDMRQGFIKYSIGNKRNDGYVFVLDIASPTNFQEIFSYFSEIQFQSKSTSPIFKENRSHIIQKLQSYHSSDQTQLLSNYLEEVHNDSMDSDTGDYLVNNAIPRSDKVMSLGDKLKSTLGIGGNAWINFNPNDNSPLNGGGLGDAESTLAHEIGHTFLMIEGRNPITRKGRELDGSAVENQYRNRIRNIGQRPLYDSAPGFQWKLPQYNQNSGKFSIYDTNRSYRLRK